ELVSDLVSLSAGARIQAIRSLPMPFNERKTIRLTSFVIIHLCNISNNVNFYLNLNLQHLIIWQDTLKEIGGRFGTSVLSYFLFLKWLLQFNLFSLIINFCFITMPQIVHAPNISSITGFRGLELLTGVGYFNQTVLFYGGYNGEVIVSKPAYNMQLAYFFTIAAYLVLCGVSLIYSICTFSQNLHMEYLPFEKRLQEKNKMSLSDRIKHLSLHLLAWLLSLGLALGSGAGIYFLGTDPELASTLLLPVVVSLINLIVPLLYSLISTIESYSNPRAKIYISIIRSVILKMSILGILCFYWLNFVPDNISCWESFVGQSVYRLLIIDFIFCLLGIFFGEFLRNVIGTMCIQSLGVPEFDIARNVLDLIYAQTLAWIGIYFSPLLPVMQVLKLFIIFYLKKISLSMNCQPPKHTGRAAQIQTVFIALLFFPSFVGVLSMVAFTVWRCDPFILHFQFLFIILLLKGLVHPKMKILSLITHPQKYQDDRQSSHVTSVVQL
uniref:Transmembrane channel-like protein n=1 Tax=Sinocyclocheilus rhinocerous TaxID=307959 RepID=A0A673KBD9_9TELE